MFSEKYTIMLQNRPAILIDAYSQIFRVFYAIAHLSRKDGFPTNALFGFARLLLQIEKEYAPKAGAMFFDCGKPAFRLELAPDYKSNRPPMPEALKQQMPLLRNLAELFGWNICQCTNYEADDLIGAAVKSDPQRQFAVISSDKDLSQLINEQISMLIPARSGGGFEVRDIEKTLEKFAVAPCQIVDYLAMLGDASDAIDGVPGIGPKTAAGILKDADSLEKFFAKPELVSNLKLRSKLQENEALLRRNIKLITLRTQWPDSELDPLEKVLQKRAPDWDAIADFARCYELKSVLKELPVAAEKKAATDSNAAAADTEKNNSEPAVDLFSWSSQAQSQTVQLQESTSAPGEDSPPIQGSLF